MATSLQDLIIENVQFHDELGNSVEAGNINTDESISLGTAVKSVINREEMKKAILKSIIRKHLKTQGMKVEGTQIEISRAYS